MSEHGEWNLKRLVKGKKQLVEDTSSLRRSVSKFEGYRKKLSNNISPETFNAILHDIEKIAYIKNRIVYYAMLSYGEDTQSEQNAALQSMISRLSSETSNKMVFFNNWWKTGIDSKNAARLIKSSGKLSYYLKSLREVGRYSLTEPEEKIITTLSPTGGGALLKLYTMIVNGFEYKFKVNGKTKVVNRAELSSFIRSKDHKTRSSSYDTLLSKYSENSKVLGEIYRNRVLAWKDNINLRKYESPISARIVADELEEVIVQALLKSCRSNIGIFREYFKFKAKELGLKRLRRYDIYAPVKSEARDKRYPYTYATKLVIDSWKGLNPRLSSLASKVINEDCIDYGIRKGKRSGAVCYGIVPSLPPYVQLSYNNDLDSIFTLAHELGHAIHYAAASSNSILTIQATIPLAESASTFSEALVFDNMKEGISKNAIRSLLFNKFEDHYATIARQAYFTLFEIDAHHRIAEGATNTELNDLYLNNLKDQFSNSVDVSKNFEAEWLNIPHFFQSPFYCYSYPFGYLLALALFQRYKKDGKAFSKDLEGIFSAGGSKNPMTLLKEYGFDISSSRFWDSGFGYLKSQLYMLKKL